jgi:hypothetical protein
MKSIARVICVLALFSFVSGEATAQSTTTTIELSSSPNPSVVGELVTFQALVTGTVPTSTVQFMDGSANLGAPAALICVTSPCIISGAGLQTSALTQGVHSITATFSGGGNNGPSSGALIQIVDAAASPAPALSSWVVTMLALLIGGVGMTSIRRLAWLIGNFKARTPPATSQRPDPVFEPTAKLRRVKLMTDKTEMIWSRAR